LLFLSIAVKDWAKPPSDHVDPYQHPCPAFSRSILSTPTTTEAAVVSSSATPSPLEAQVIADHEFEIAVVLARLCLAGEPFQCSFLSRAIGSASHGHD
jgi:hypothetical protein